MSEDPRQSNYRDKVEHSRESKSYDSLLVPPPQSVESPMGMVMDAGPVSSSAGEGETTPPTDYDG
jgi:hypothetical protein